MPATTPSMTSTLTQGHGHGHEIVSFASACPLNKTCNDSWLETERKWDS